MIGRPRLAQVPEHACRSEKVRSIDSVADGDGKHGYNQAKVSRDTLKESAIGVQLHRKLSQEPNGS